MSNTKRSVKTTTIPNQKQANPAAHTIYKIATTTLTQANKENEPVNQVYYQKSQVSELEKAASKSKNKKSFRPYNGEVKFGISTVDDDDDEEEVHQQKKKVELCKFHGEPVYKGKSGHCYGYFRCDCGRTWESGNCWEGYEQKCKSCGTKVYPYCKHYLVISKNRSDPNKPHPMHLCGKCRALGSPCYKIHHYDPTDFQVPRASYISEDEDEEDYNYDYDNDNDDGDHNSLSDVDHVDDDNYDYGYDDDDDDDDDEDANDDDDDDEEEDEDEDDEDYGGDNDDDTYGYDNSDYVTSYFNNYYHSYD